MDIYAEFGVNSAVMSSSDPEEHEQNMLKMDVRARDGDSSIELDQEEGEEGSEEEGQEEGEESGEEEEGQEEGEESTEGEPLGEPDDELVKASDSISKYADGFSHMRDQAIQNGLSEDMAAQVEAEYEADKGLSDASYQALAKAGYSKEFIDSYIQGQEAVAEQFVNKVVDYAGGQERFQQIIQHLNTNSPGAVDSLYEALERQDLNSIRTIINLGSQSHTKKFGKAPTRSVIKAAPSVPAQRVASKVAGYESQKAMVKDMSSREYRQDPEFRAKVEARVGASQF